MGWQNLFATVLQAGNTTVINAKGLFIYAGVPALGNLIVSAATSAGVDSVGNAFPQGLNVTMGSISGSTIFVGNDTIINSNGIFVYSGTPALNNLIGSWAPTSGTDSFGNFYEAGIWIYDNFGNATGLVPGGATSASHVEFAPGTGTPTPLTGNAALFANNSGEVIVRDGGDTQTYAIQRRTQQLGTGTIGTTATTLTTFTVTARAYRVSGKIFFQAGTTQTASFNINCSGSSSNAAFDLTVKRATALLGATYSTVLNGTTGTTASLTSPNIYVAEVDGVVTFGAGTFNMDMLVSTGTASLLGGFIDLMPV